MTILSALLWAAKGKYVLVLEDDLVDSENESHFDIIANRIQIWHDRGLKYAVVADHRIVADAGAKDNKLSTKVSALLAEHKIHVEPIPAAPRHTAEVADNMRLIASMGEEYMEAWLSGRATLKSMSIRSWADIRQEAVDFLAAHSKEPKRVAPLNDTVARIRTLIEEEEKQFPSLVADAKRPKPERFINLFKKVKESQRDALINYILNLDANMASIGFAETLVQTLRTNDRVILYVGRFNTHLPVQERLLHGELKLDLVHRFGHDLEEGEALSDRELSTALDAFAPKKKAAKKKKKGGKAEEKKPADSASAGAESPPDDLD